MEKPVHPLRTWRAQTHTTLEQLADAVKVSASLLSDIENGNKRPGLRTAARLEEQTGISMRQFAGASQ